MKNYVLLLSIILASLPCMAVSADYQDVETQLQQALNVAQQSYTKQVKIITAKRAPKLKKLHQLESKSLVLRSKLAADIRAKDEQYLSLKQIQSRLGKWQDQNRFVHNQLNSLSNSQEQVSSRVVALFQRRLTALSTRLSPQWRKADAVKDSGEVVTGWRLNTGPLNWIKHNEQLYISELIDSQNTLKMSIKPASVEPIILASELSNDLGETQSSWQWLQTDITAGKATAIAAKTVNYWQKLQVGGIWSYPILGFGLLSLIMVLIKFLQLMRLSRLNTDYAQDIVSRHIELTFDGVTSKPNNPHWQQQLAALAWQVRAYDIDKTSDQLFGLLMLFKGQLDRGMSLLAATAAVAPLLGLLGTVSGMIHTFEMMNLFGNKDQSLLSGGISEALFTTELGLIVAIPALLAHAYLSRKHQSYLNQLEHDSVLLAHLGKPQPRESAC